jgi:hypothetical protein
MPRVRVPQHVTRLVIDYFAYTARPSTSARRVAHCRLLCLAQALRRLRRLRRASGCLGTSHDSSSTTSPRADSSSTTSPTPRLRVPWHVRQLVAGSSSTTSPHASSPSMTSHTSRVRVPQHVARLVVEYFASRSLIVDYFTYVATPCDWVPQLVSRLVVDYFAYAVRPGALARRVARRRSLRLRQLVVHYFGLSRGSSSTTSPRAARRRLLCVRRASGCLSSSSTTSPRVACRLLFLAQARRRLLRLRRASGCLGNTGSTSSMPRTTATSSFGRIASTTHLD